MDKELLKLSASNDLDKLNNAVKNISEDDINKMVERSFSTKDQNFIKLLMALFKAFQSAPSSSQTSSSSLNTKRACLFTTCINMLANRDMSTKLATDIVRLLIVEMETLPISFLVKLSNDIIAHLKDEQIESYRFLEVLPKLLHLMRAEHSIILDCRTIEGEEFQNCVIKNICSVKWNSNSVVHIASIFKEIRLSSDELRPLILKFLRSFHSMDVQEIPPLVYQLLILSSKGCKNLLLDGIIRYFTSDLEPAHDNRKEATGTIMDDIYLIEDSPPSQSAVAVVTSSRLQPIESTVIYHMTFSIKQNQELGKELVKYLKVSEHSGRREMLSSFVISLALSISKISTFESQVLDLLTQIVTYCFKDQRRKWESKWLNENSSPCYDVTNHVMSSVKQMLIEWDVVMDGLVPFAFSLMEIPAAKNSFGRIAAPSPTEGNQPSPAMNINMLGVKILEQGSKVHTNVAVEIVNQLINRIITKGQDHVPCHFIDLLVSLLRSSPHTYIDNSTKFRDVFDYFSFLPLPTCRLLVSAMLPVVRICPTFKNALVLFLRKSLFSRQIEMRKVAVSSFLLLLKNFKVLAGFTSSQSQGSSSQITADVHRDNNKFNNDNKSLCLEIINSLRRCFGQQHDVRSLLYNGLYDVAANNSVLLGPIADLLFTQLKIYFDPNETNLPPLKINSCISLNLEIWQAVEPLPELVMNLIRCVDCLKNKNSREEVEEGFVARVDVILESVATRLIKCDADDFELEKDSGFNTSTPAGSRNLSLSQIIIETYEVFIQREVTRGDVNEEKVESMLKFYQVLSQVVDATKPDDQRKKGKPKKTNLTFEPQKSTSPCTLGRHFSLDFVVKIMKAMFEQDNNTSKLILSNNNFCNYFFNSTTMLLQQFAVANNNSTIDDFMLRFCSYAVDDPERVNSDLSDLARLLLMRYLRVVIKPNNTDISISATANNNNNANKNQPITSKTLNSNCLKIFHQILSLFSKKWSNRVPGFLIHLDIATKNNKKLLEKDSSEGPVLYVKMFQRIFVTLLTSEGDTFSPKDRLLTMQCLIILIDNCQKEAALAQCCDWFMRLFKEHIIEDLELLKLTLKKQLSLLRRTDLNLTFIKDVCRDIHSCLGDVDQQVELDTSNNLPAVNHRSSVAIIQSILSHLELEIEDSDWLIERTKSQLMSFSFSSPSPPTNDEDDAINDNDVTCSKLVDGNMKEAYKSLIDRISSMTDVFHELVQASVPFGPSVECVFRVLNKFYTLLCSLVKLYIWVYTHKSKEVDFGIKGSFEKLIKHTAVQLTRFVYPMITHVEKVESEKLQAENEKHKKNNKKKNAPIEKVKRMKETKLIPFVILRMEQYERLLIQLSKKSKVNLMAHFKVSTSRDFRINNATLQGILENRANDQNDDDDGGGDDDHDDRTRNKSIANDNDEDDDVEDEIASMMRNDDESNEAEDGEMSAPVRKRAKLSRALPQPKTVTDGKKLSRKKN